MGAVPQLYRTVHQCVITVLASSGVHANRWGRSSTLHRDSEPFLCFQRRTEEDLIVSGYKILGSAQRRGTNGVIQHGSLLLEASPLAPQLPGLAELAGSTGFSFVSDIASEIAKVMNLRWSKGFLSPEERLLASEIEKKRFGNSAWVCVR